MRPKVPMLAFRGPFGGLSSEADPRNVAVGDAVDMDNCMTRDGHLTQRPGLVDPPCFGGGVFDPGEAEMRSVGYVGGDVDYVTAIAEDAIWMQSFRADFLPDEWGRPVSRYDLSGGEKAIFSHLGDTYFATGGRNVVYRNVLESRRLTDCGMDAIDLDAVTSYSFDETATSGNVPTGKTFECWVSRYNAKFRIESNATRVGEVTTTGQCELEVEIVDIPTTMVGEATHYRIYLQRADGIGYPGLIATVEFDESDGTFNYVIGDTDVGNELVGGSDGADTTYSEGDDDANYEYAPPTMNGVPPAAVDFAYWRGRMFYLTADGRIYFSQNVDELQGGLEAVPATSYRQLPFNDRGVAIKLYRDSLCIFGASKVYRLTGSVNSLTNRQVVLGVLDDEIVQTDVLDDIENSVGCISRDSIVEVLMPTSGSVLIFASADGVYRFDGVSSTPLTLGRIQKEYVAILTEYGNRVSAGHYQVGHLVVLCFVPNRNQQYRFSVLAYDYVAGNWLKWSTYYTSSTEGVEATCPFMGPLCTMAPSGSGASLCYVIRSARDTGVANSTRRLGAVFDLDAVSDVQYGVSPTSIPCEWLGPNTDLGYAGRQKRVEYFKSFFEKTDSESDGYIQPQVHPNGDSGYPIPGSPKFWSTRGGTLRIGGRFETVQPYWIFVSQSKTTRMKIFGYAFDGRVVGMR